MSKSIRVSLAVFAFSTSTGLAAQQTYNMLLVSQFGPVRIPGALHPPESAGDERVHARA